jgi:hypothetical protein
MPLHRSWSTIYTTPVGAVSMLTMTSATPDVLSTLCSDRALRASAFSLGVDTHRVAALRPHAPHGTPAPRSPWRIQFSRGALTLLTGRHAALRAARAYFSRWVLTSCLLLIHYTSLVSSFPLTSCLQSPFARPDRCRHSYTA